MEGIMITNQHLRCGLLYMTFVLFSSGTLGEAVDASVPQLFVRGEAELMVSPDQVSVVLGVTTESSTAKKAMAENTQTMQAIIQALHKLGLVDKDYKTQNFRVQPLWSSRPKGESSQWKPNIIAHRVSNDLRVTTTLLNRVGEIIADTTSAGANQIHSIEFSLSDERQYRSQAITQAMENAKADAQTLALASGDKIKRTMSLRLDNSSASVMQVESFMEKSRLMMADQAPLAPPPIESGDVRISASVSVVYELEK
jgi:uncharacterized protein